MGGFVTQIHPSGNAFLIQFGIDIGAAKFAVHCIGLLGPAALLHRDSVFRAEIAQMLLHDSSRNDSGRILVALLGKVAGHLQKIAKHVRMNKLSK